MTQFRWNAAVAAILLLTIALPAVAAEYADPSGFSLTVPEGWVAASGLNMDHLPPETRAWIAKNNIDLSEISVMVLPAREAEFLENMNVVIEHQQIPISNKSIQELTAAMTRQYQTMGLTIEGLQGRLTKIGTNEVIVLEFGSRLPGVPFPLRQRQIFFVGGGKTYIVTCSSKADEYASDSATFDAILASFKVPPPSNKLGFKLHPVMKMTLVGGIVGAVAGVLIWLFRTLFGSSKA